MNVELVPLEILRPHEQILPKKVDQLEKMTHRWNAYTKPLLLDRSTGTILDGHHRYHVAKRLELICVPCVFIDYLEDDLIELDVWPNCGRDLTCTIRFFQRRRWNQKKSAPCDPVHRRLQSFE